MEKAMLEFTEKMTLASSSMTQADVQALRNVGWADRDILDIAQVAAYFNYRARIADALGVDLDEKYLNRAREGAKRAEKIADERKVAMPQDRWRVRQSR
jgi:uncharacterized protein YciW